MNVLIGGVGYHNMRDLSVGPMLVPALRRLRWPPGVEVHDLSYGPIAVIQWLQERPGYFKRGVFIAAVQRGREAGQVYCYRWPNTLPDEEEIQQRVGEAVTGVISLDNLLILAQFFKALPPEVIVVEVEPEDTNWGPGLSLRVEAALSTVVDIVRREALKDSERRRS